MVNINVWRTISHAEANWIIWFVPKTKKSLTLDIQIFDYYPNCYSILLSYFIEYFMFFSTILSIAWERGERVVRDTAASYVYRSFLLFTLLFLQWWQRNSDLISLLMEYVILYFCWQCFHNLFIGIKFHWKFFIIHLLNVKLKLSPFVSLFSTLFSTYFVLHVINRTEN